MNEPVERWILRLGRGLPGPHPAADEFLSAALRLLNPLQAQSYYQLMKIWLRSLAVCFLAKIKAISKNQTAEVKKNL